MSAPQLVIVTPGDTHPLVESAGTELRRYLQLLFELDVPIKTTHSLEELASDVDLLVVGQEQDTTIAGLTTHAPARSPFTEQSIRLQSFDRDGHRVLLIAGGSPVATLWAVYDLVAHFGVRYEMMGDVLPSPHSFKWPEIDQQSEPAFRIRGLSPKNNLPEGAASWSLPDYRRYIDQMVKLKFNLFFWRIREWGPWLQYEFRGFRKQRGDVYYGFRYPIREDTIGREYFGGEDEFYPAALKPARHDAERFVLGQQLLHEVLAYARSRGLQTSLGLELTDLPTEFKEQFNEWIPEATNPSVDWDHVHQSRTPLVEYGVNPRRIKWQNWAHATVQDLAETRIQALVETYPDADFYTMEQTEHVASVVGYQECLDYLDARYDIRSLVDLEAMLGHADHYDFLRPRIGRPGRYESTLKGELEFPYLYDRLFEERRVMERTRRPQATVGMTTGFVMQEYFSILPAILRPGTVVQAVLEYGFHRTARRMESFAPLRDSGIRAWIHSTFQDDNNMWIPQVCVRSLYDVAQAARRNGVEGLTASHWEVRPYEIDCRYLAQLGWNPDLTPDEFYAIELADTFGAEAVPHLRRAFSEWEALDVFNRDKLISLASSWHGAYEKFLLNPDQFNPDDIRRSLAGFRRVLGLFEAARDMVDADGLRYLNYYINRFEAAVAFEELALVGQQIGRTYAVAQAAQAAGDQVTAQSEHTRASELVQRALDQAAVMIGLYAQDIAAIEDKAVLAGFNRWIWYYLLALRDELQAKPAGTASLADASRGDS